MVQEQEGRLNTRKEDANLLPFIDVIEKSMTLIEKNKQRKRTKKGDQKCHLLLVSHKTVIFFLKDSFHNTTKCEITENKRIRIFFWTSGSSG